MPADSITIAGTDEDGFEKYHRLYGAATDLARTDRRFHARVAAFRIPRMVVFERRVGGVRHGRDWARVGRDGFDHITLHVPIAGDLAAGPAGAERRLLPGEILVVDTARPHVSQIEDAHLLTVQLARAHVQEVIDVDDLHGVVLPEVACGLLVDFVVSFTQRIGALSPDVTGHAARAAIELLALGVKSLPASARAVSTEAGDALRRTRAEAFIAARLSDPGLNADTVAAGIGTSRSVLYRVFGSDGGVRRFIQRRRLEGLRRALLHPGEGRRMGTLAHAYGFSSQSHCNRAFAAAYGLPPGQFQAELRDADPAGAAGPSPSRAVQWAHDLY